MYWSSNFLGVVFKKQEISRHGEPTNKHNSHQNAGFSIWVFKNFPGVIPPDPHSGRGRPPAPAPNTQKGRARGASAQMLGPKPWSPSTFQPWLPAWTVNDVDRCRLRGASMSISFLKHYYNFSTDRRTDGQTDRILIARPRLHCMQRRKKVINFWREKSAPQRKSWLRQCYNCMQILIPTSRIVSYRIGRVNVRTCPVFTRCMKCRRGPAMRQLSVCQRRELCEFARCYGWGATSKYRLKIGDFAPTGAADPKFQVEGVAPYQPFFFSES